MTRPFEPRAARQHFPSLLAPSGGAPIFLDNPGGTQVPVEVIEAVTRYYVGSNSNCGGAFETSRRTDEMLAEAHAAVADFLGARSADEVVFGPNMTTLTFALSRAIGRTLRPGDEIVVTRLDHDANIAPWVALAENGAVIRWADFRAGDCTLDMPSLAALIGPRTKVVAVGYASNACGTINDVQAVARLAHAVGARVFVDAVHYAPHGPIDVAALDCDFLACSVYKFFGPHVGVLYGKHELLDSLPAYKVRPAGDAPPDKFETGTQNHEGIAGTLAAITYLEWLGKEFGEPSADRRGRLCEAMVRVAAYERTLSEGLVKGLQSLARVRIHGIVETERFEHRTPTVCFSVDGLRPREVTEQLARHGIYAWDGNYYAIEFMRRLGLEAQGGAVRVGAVHYNTLGEIERMVEVLRGLP